jgi:hypothetical protein
VPFAADTRHVLLKRELFRSVNERINALNAPFSDLLPCGGFVCECGGVDCLEIVAAPLEVYAAVRRSPGRHLVVPQHLVTAFDVVIERHEDCWIVESVQPRVDDGERQDCGVCGGGGRGAWRGRGLAAAGESAAVRHNSRRGR